MRVKTGFALTVQHFADDDRAFNTGIFRNLTQRRFQSAADNIDTRLNIGIVVGQFFNRLRGQQKRRATARNNTGFNSGASCVQRIIDAVFTLFHFHFRGTADFQHGNTAGQFRDTLLQLFTVIIGCGVFDLRADLRHTRLNVFFIASAVNNHRVIFGDIDALGRAQHIEGHIF